MKNVLVWFRNDLRIADNPALYHAVSKAKKDSANVFACVIMSPEEDKQHDRSPHQVDFMLRNLKILSQSLYTSFNIPLLVRIAETKSGVFDHLQSLVSKLDIGHLFFNNQYEIDEHRRDAKAENMLSSAGVQVSRFDDQIVVPPGVLRSKSNDTMFSVYSPFRKAWQQYVYDNQHLLDVFTVDKFKNQTDIKPDGVPDSLPGFALDKELRSTLLKEFPAGESEAQKRLKKFGDERIEVYKKRRDFPGEPSTSRLSPYLAIGVLSNKQCIVEAMSRNGDSFDSGNDGVVHWIQELVWREFFRHVLVAFPRVSMNRPFRLETERVEWLYDEKTFEKWCQGKTGYPIVDAAMRQLNQTGWLHNRCRMIVASFLVKDLLHNWMLGEKYFSQNLIDCDLASNNGGWQWSASTGCDGQPFFRVFNPLLQAQRFDPDGDYIRKWIPELRCISDNNAIHDPQKHLGMKKIQEIGYYPKIVDHSMARDRAIQAFERLKDPNQKGQLENYGYGKREGADKAVKKAKSKHTTK
ncbi:hypothetical protein MIR68_012585 [Amoeboaphelidium protococcarum]|nr:hypothetical protein MIR68_012585 [Amoeboaphelidium protococcarum]